MPDNAAPETDAETATLAKAVEGLLYPSESDEPFKVFRWPGRQDMQELAVRCSNAMHLEIESCTKFFEDLRQGDDAARYDALEQTISKVVSECRVYRVGKIRVQIFVGGRAPDGDWVGVSTISTETG